MKSLKKLGVGTQMHDASVSSQAIALPILRLEQVVQVLTRWCRGRTCWMTRNWHWKKRLGHKSAPSRNTNTIIWKTSKAIRRRIWEAGMRETVCGSSQGVEIDRTYCLIKETVRRGAPVGKVDRGSLARHAMRVNLSTIPRSTHWHDLDRPGPDRYEHQHFVERYSLPFVRLMPGLICDKIF